MKTVFTPIVLSVALAATGLANATDWPQLRGPNHNGSTEVTGLPSTFSKTENMRWVADLPGPSAATPVVVGDRVFISSTDAQKHVLLALCLDRQTGKVLWQQEVAPGFRRDDRSNFASPTPAADQERVIFFYGTGDLVAFDHAGKKLWSRNLQTDYGQFAFQWTFSTSPLLAHGKLYMQVLQRDVPVGGRGRTDGPNDSYLLALDPATGQEFWRHIRPAEARAESLEAFSTPVPYEYNGRAEILIAGGDCLTGHDPTSGRELWRWGTWNPTRITHWRLVPSPVAGAGVVLVGAPKRDPVYAIKAGGTGELADSAILWKSDPRQDGVSTDVPTPLFYQGDFFVLGDGHRTLARIEPATGKVKWSIETPGRSKFETSPTGADGKIYIMNFAGEVTVANATDGKILHTVALGEPGDDSTRSSIVAAHGALFVRTNSKLFCFGN